MNKGIVAGIIVVIVAALGGAGILFISSGDDTGTTTSGTPPANSQSGLPTVDTSGPQGKLVRYSDEELAEAAGKKKVVFFTAPWCVVCEAIKRNIDAGRIPEDLVILEADFDRDTDLRSKYEVLQQTTLVQIDDQGNEINKWVMYDTRAGVDEIVENLI